MESHPGLDDLPFSSFCIPHSPLKMPGRDTKAELNRRSQVCDALAGTGVRVAKTIGIPCWNCTSLCGSADRRLGCSANGM
jgi:hypothetical protein